MEIKESIILFILGYLGFLAHCLMKAQSIKKNYIAANIEFDWKKDYLQRDMFAILLALLPTPVWYFIWEEIVGVYPKLANLIRFSFLTVGISGSYFLQLLAGAAEKIGRRVVDAKTNISDSQLVQAVTGTKIEKEDVIKKSDGSGSSAPISPIDGV